MATGNFTYTKEHDMWLKENYIKYNSYKKIADDFNHRFGAIKSVSAIQQRLCKRIGVYLNTAKKSTHYTEAEEKWLIENYNKFDNYTDLTTKLNNTFGKNKTVNSVRDKCTKQLKLKGIISQTSFKTGHAQTQLPIGTVRKSTNGAVYVKVRDSSLSRQSGYREPYWVPIQKKVWVDRYGEVPDGKMVIFLDCNSNNIDISNLYCIDRKISAIMASNGWYSSNRDLTLAAIKWCELFYAIKCNY